MAGPMALTLDFANLSSSWAGGDVFFPLDSSDELDTSAELLQLADEMRAANEQAQQLYGHASAPTDADCSRHRRDCQALAHTSFGREVLNSSSSKQAGGGQNFHAVSGGNSNQVHLRRGHGAGHHSLMLGSDGTGSCAFALANLFSPAEMGLHFSPPSDFLGDCDGSSILGGPCEGDAVHAYGELIGSSHNGLNAGGQYRHPPRDQSDDSIKHSNAADHGSNSTGNQLSQLVASKVWGAHPWQQMDAQQPQQVVPGRTNSFAYNSDSESGGCGSGSAAVPEHPQWKNTQQQRSTGMKLISLNSSATDTIIAPVSNKRVQDNSSNVDWQPPQQHMTSPFMHATISSSYSHAGGVLQPAHDSMSHLQLSSSQQQQGKKQELAWANSFHWEAPPPQKSSQNRQSQQQQQQQQPPPRQQQSQHNQLSSSSNHPSSGSSNAHALRAQLSGTPEAAVVPQLFGLDVNWGSSHHPNECAGSNSNNNSRSQLQMQVQAAPTQQQLAAAHNLGRPVTASLQQLHSMALPPLPRMLAAWQLQHCPPGLFDFDPFQHIKLEDRGSFGLPMLTLAGQEATASAAMQQGMQHKHSVQQGLQHLYSMQRMVQPEASAMKQSTMLPQLLTQSAQRMGSLQFVPSPKAGSITPPSTARSLTPAMSLPLPRAASKRDGSGAHQELVPLRTRRECVQRYREKKARRTHTKKIRYQLRKENADARPRIKGRFVKKGELVGDAAMPAQQVPASEATAGDMTVDMDEDAMSDSDYC